MKKRIVFCSLIALSLSLFALHNTYTMANATGIPSDSSEKAAVAFVNSIKTSKNGENTLKSITKESKDISKFDKKYQSQNNPYNQNRSIFENNELSIEIDDTGSPITFTNKDKRDNPPAAKYDGNPTEVAKIKKLDKTKLDGIANEVLKKISNENVEFVESSDLSEGYISYKWSRVSNNYKHNLDFILVILDPSDGDIVSVSKKFVSDLPKNEVKISSDKAKEIAKSYVSNDDSLTDILKSEILVVNPMDTANLKQFNKDSRIAYEITFNKIKPVPGETKIWVDAETGQILGRITTK